MQEGAGATVGGGGVDEEVVEAVFLESADEATLMTPGFKEVEDKEEEEVAQEGKPSRARNSAALCWAVESTTPLLSTA